MILIAPGQDTRVVRYGQWWPYKKWHILKEGTSQTGICRAVCADPEYSTIGELRPGELCKRCWQFGEAVKIVYQGKAKPFIPKDLDIEVDG